MEAGEGLPDPEEAVRFEDLTVDDDLPILERIVRYTQSQIALQRLVHVKMLGETAELAGILDTQEVIVPLLNGLMTDAESVIRQHLAAQLLTVSIVCMLDPSHNVAPVKNKHHSKHGRAVDSLSMIQATQWIEHPEWPKVYDETGYALVADIITGKVLRQLIRDVDVDVRRAAADALTGLALQIRVQDIGSVILPIPLQLAADHKPAPIGVGGAPAQPLPQAKKTEADQQAEEWRMTSANLLAELGGAVAEQAHLTAAAAAAASLTDAAAASTALAASMTAATTWGSSQLVPAVLEFTADASFRVRRAAAQALPRILGAAPVNTVLQSLLPAFEQLSKDELYRVRKSTGECLVDMSRSLVILAASAATSPTTATQAKKLLEARRSILIPIADRLIQDEHKMVRQGMMQFLGPFMASFYPFFHSSLDDLLPASSESDGSNHMGIVAQFFPHATSMVSRLNSSQNAVTTAPTPVLIDPVLHDSRLELERLQHALPLFLQASRQSAHALRAVRLHRQEQAPPAKDLEAIVNGLLDYFAALAIVQTGDENTDAEMRVYCAYSFPAVVLLLGAENWQGALKTCFLTLLNPSYAEDEDDDDDDDNNKEGQPPPPKPSSNASEPPLPVKRCLASSLHTVAHILGPDIAVRDILPVFTDYFLRDSDEAVRLNIIRGFPTFLGILPTVQHRTDLFLAWSKVMHGEDCLGAKKRSATNPLVLNWRQRDYLARSLPDLLPLLPPELIHAHIWPICQQLLFDSVSLVRDDVLWTVPMMFKVYTPDTVAQKWSNNNSAAQGTTAKKRSSNSGSASSAFSSKTAVNEIITWFNEQVLKQVGTNNTNGSTGSAHGSTSGSMMRKSGGFGGANFCDRQLFCRLCGTIGLSLRLNEEIRASGKKDLAAALGESFASLFFGTPSSSAPSVIEEPPLELPYQKLSISEHKHLKKILEEQLLPMALTMKDDRIRNVRVTLLKVLQILPNDLRESPPVKSVLVPLHEEVLTWESFGGEDEPPLGPPPPPPVPPPQPSAASSGADSDSPKKNRRSKREKEARSSSTGPVDIDDVKPEEDEEDHNEDKGASNEELESKSRRSSTSRKTRKEDAENDADADKSAKGLEDFMSEEDASMSKDRRKQMKRSKSGRSHSSKGSKSSKSGSSTPSKKQSSKISKKPTTQTVMEEGDSPHAAATEEADESGWKTVIFEDGPIGLQLEPTADDTACRVYGFLETGSARKSGKIQLGDVICKVNDVKVHSYDETVDMLKRGGRRAVTFRPGTASDSLPSVAVGTDDSVVAEDHQNLMEDSLQLSDNEDAAEASAKRSKKKSSSTASSGSKKKSSSSSAITAGSTSSSSKLPKTKKKKKSSD
ncbi:hypothetical protein ACA910_008280 [Epithemia clementina (nom. ined.)]